MCESAGVQYKLSGCNKIQTCEKPQALGYTLKLDQTCNILKPTYAKKVTVIATMFHSFHMFEAHFFTFFFIISDLVALTYLPMDP